MALAATLAVVPPTIAVVGEHLPAPDVVAPLLLIATVPLLVVGALIELVRQAPSGLERIWHHFFLEWVLLATGITVIYTGLVAGLGRLVGGSGPAWLLVAATGVIAVLVEPARRRQVRALVDRLVYGSRDDTHCRSSARSWCVSVRRTRARSCCLRWPPASGARCASMPSPSTSPGPADRSAPRVVRRRRRRHPVAPAHHCARSPSSSTGEIVGRLMVGWADAASLRARDERRWRSWRPHWPWR